MSAYQKFPAVTFALRLRSFALPALLLSSSAFAAPPSTSPYVVDLQKSHVEDATSEGIGQVNMITCIMAAMRPEALVNQGNYNALVDESKCKPNGSSDGASSGAGGDAAQAATFMTAVVNASRATNSDPMVSKIWIVEEEEGQQTNIDVRVSASAAPTTGNPYGIFQLYYCGYAGTGNSCRMNGSLEGSTTGIRYFHTETRDDGQGVYTVNDALQLNASSTGSGSGRMQKDSSQDGQSAFDFAYNATLYRRFDGSDDQCYSRDANDPDTGMSVWRYGLYDGVTGARITRNSGFPIDFTHGGETYHGYLGYSGLSLPSVAMALLVNGSTVQKVEYTSGQAPTKTDYTTFKAGGKLMKFTRQTRTLRGIDRVKFTSFVMNAGGFYSGAVSNTQYEMYWDDAAGNFKVTGRMTCDGNGCQTQTLSQEETVSVAFWQNQAGVQGWSQQLGGELFISLQGATTSPDSAVTNVVYRTQDLVYPTQLPASLYCLRDCPTSASLASYFAPGSQDTSPFVASTYNNWMPSALAVSYTTDTTVLLKDGLGQPVTFADADAFRQNPQYRYGLRSGKLFPVLLSAECFVGSGTYCDSKVNDLEVYYQWETGPDSHSQFAGVKNAQGEFLQFDAPLQVSFTVPAGQGYGDYAGQKIVLQYNGFGDLWGIPGHCVSRLTNETVECNGQDSRYVPAFVIPYDAVSGQVSSGSDHYLVKWLDREIRFAKKPLGSCTVAQLTTPVGSVLPTAAVLKSPHDPNSDVYIGTKPVVTTAPRVIHGEVKY
jgi:hypothetical protein